MAPRDRQRFRERFRREPRVEANGGGGEETYENPGFIAACSTAQTNRPEVNVRSNPLFDRATTGHPLCGPAAFESPDKSFNPFPPQRGGGSSVSWPVVGQEFLLFVRACAFLLWEKILGRFYFRMVFNDEIITE